MGLQTCQETIKSMVDTARAKASVDDACHWMLSPDWEGLDAIGMGLSGCEDELANEHFVDQLLARYPKLSKYGHTVSDTIGSMYTACPDGKRRWAMKKKKKKRGKKRRRLKSDKHFPWP